MRLVAMLQVYNEVACGNLERCLKSLSRYVDGIVVYDDASTDNPFPLYKEHNCLVHAAQKNDFENELQHKQLLVDIAKNELRADWILRIDADEVIEANGERELRALCENGEHTSWAFHMTNFWRHPAYYRLDAAYNDVVFNRLWKVPPEGLKFRIEPGLHKTNYPIGATTNEGFSDLEILHYGFASDEAILAKYRMYAAHGQTGWPLNRLIDESTLRVDKSDAGWFVEPITFPSLAKVYGVPLRQRLLEGV